MSASAGTLRLGGWGPSSSTGPVSAPMSRVISAARLALDGVTDATRSGAATQARRKDKASCAGISNLNPGQQQPTNLARPLDFASASDPNLLHVRARRLDAGMGGSCRPALFAATGLHRHCAIARVQRKDLPAPVHSALPCLRNVGAVAPDAMCVAGECGCVSCWSKTSPKWSRHCVPR